MTYLQHSFSVQQNGFWKSVRKSCHCCVGFVMGTGVCYEVWERFQLQIFILYGCAVWNWNPCSSDSNTNWRQVSFLPACVCVLKCKGMVICWLIVDMLMMDLWLGGNTLTTETNKNDLLNSCKPSGEQLPAGVCLSCIFRSICRPSILLTSIWAGSQWHWFPGIARLSSVWSTEEIPRGAAVRKWHHGVQRSKGKPRRAPKLGSSGP